MAPLLPNTLVAPDVLTDDAAIAEAEALPVAAPTDPPADLVERLACAMARPRRWQRIVDPERDLAYYQVGARHRLAALDPLARGLLLQIEEAAARKFVNQIEGTEP